MKDTFENVEWMHEILEFSSTGLWRIRMDQNTGTNEMYASKSMLKLLGLKEHPAPEECYEHWFSRIDKDYLEYCQNSVAKMISTGEQIEVQYLWEHPELGKIFVRCSGKLEHAKNDVYEIHGYHQNIAEMVFHKAEQDMSVEEMMTARKLNKLENKAKLLTAQSDAWKSLIRTLLKKTDAFEIFYYPKERKMVFPESVAQLYHWNKEYEGMPYHFSKEFVDEVYRSVFEDMFEHIHRGIGTTDSEISMKNGKKWFNTNLSVVECDENGEPELAIGIVEDITEKKINQLENIELQSIYKFTVNNDYECLVIVDLETRQYSVRYTEKWAMSEQVEEEITEKSFKKFLAKVVKPIDLEKFNLNNIINRLNYKKGETHVIWYKDTNEEHKEARCYWIEENKKILITIRNVEKRWKKEAENKKKILEALEMAEAANQAKSDFISRISHDIRTPLNAVVGMVAIAKKYKDDTSKVEECLEAINNSSHYLTLLINDVLDLAKIENEKMKLNTEEFTLDDFINKMINVVQPLIDSRKHKLTVSMEQVEHKQVKGDFVRLQQLLLNILSNAVKYTNPGGHIEFTIREFPSEKEGFGYYQFEVRDNGIGMEKEFLTHLFNPYERDETEEVAHIEGTGLGMSIAKNIANLMDGDIVVDSEPGVGSDFFITVYLELQDETVWKESAEGEEKPIPDYSGKNILLVEDNAINMEIAMELISATGANIETAENGREAVKMVQLSSQGHYDLIFMDIRMPVMNGYETVSLLRAFDREDMKTIPIVAMTADAFAEDIRRAKECGMDEHIAKPIDIDKLYDIMRKYENE